MRKYISDEDTELLYNLLKKEGAGNLLVGYETDKGKPHAESSYMLYPADPDRQHPDYTFMALIHIETKKAQKSAFIPDTRLEMYSFPKMTDVPAIPGNASMKEYINQTLLPYIRKKGLKPQMSANLRNLMFARLHSDILTEDGRLPQMTTGQLDELIRFHQKQDGLAARYGYNPVFKLPLHVIETSKGMLFFSDTKVGRDGLKGFYQQLADNYFWVHSEPGPVREYSTYDLSPDICPLVDACIRENDKGEKYGYNMKDAMSPKDMILNQEEWELTFETDMKPTSLEFSRLTEFARCSTSHNNADVSKLLYLMENGFKRDLAVDPAFGYQNVFREYATRIDHCINGQSSGDELPDILDDLRWKAENILQTEFDVRGHRTLEKVLNDKSVPFLINGTDASEAMRQALLEKKWIYCPEKSGGSPRPYYIHAEETCDRVMIYLAPPKGETVYQEKNGKIIPYAPHAKNVLKASKNNSPKIK